MLFRDFWNGMKDIVAENRVVVVSFKIALWVAKQVAMNKIQQDTFVSLLNL